MPGSSNHVSLQSAQRNFEAFGSSELRYRGHGREPDEIDRKDKHWRSFDETQDNPEEPQSGIDYATSYPIDSTVLYYWRTTYWRRVVA